MPNSPDNASPNSKPTEAWRCAELWSEEVYCSNPLCAGDSDDLCQFSIWIRNLDTAVIQEEFGYEPGEFCVFPAHWFPLFLEGLTPRQAWQRALDAHND